METTILEILFPYSFLFKSYYVVWKPLAVEPVIFSFLRFKSYYVVWKPTCTSLIMNDSPV